MQPNCNTNNQSTGAWIPGKNNLVWHSLCSRLSASKPKYTFDFSEEEEDDEEEADEEENGEDVASSPVRSLKNDFGFSDSKDRYDDHNENEEDDHEDSYSSPKQKTA